MPVQREAHDVGGTAGNTDVERTAADRLGIAEGMLVQEIGNADDVDTELVEAVRSRTGTPLADDTGDDVVDVVLLWWREDDGDLVDALMEARTRLEASGTIWLLTPKAGRDRHVEPSDILEAAPTAGLSQTSSISVSKDWSGSRLVSKKAQRSKK
jgi:hypothetical protein